MVIKCLAILSLLLSDVMTGTFHNTIETDGELILVRLHIENKVSYDVDAFLIDENIYLPAAYLFDLLKVRYTVGENGNKYAIEFPDDKKPVNIDLTSDTKQILSNKSPEIIWHEDDAYLSVPFLTKLFDFKFTFNFRKLTLNLLSKHTLPLIKELNRSNRYKYVDGSGEERYSSISPDNIIKSKRYLANGWLTDWSINNSFSFDQQPNISGNAGLGGQLLGGSISMNGSASGKNGIHWQSMRGNWTFPVHSTPLVQQIQIGDVQQPGVETSMSGFRGFLISNRPNERPVYFSTQTYEGLLEDDWDVEFYVNRKLEGYELGSDSKQYVFDTPLFYGANHVQLKYYDTKGLHHQKQYMLQIPYDFLRPGKVQYDLSAGEYSTLSGNKYANSNVRLGVLPSLTLGGGVFYELDKFDEKGVYPYLQSWLRLGSRISLTGSYMHNHVAFGSIRYTSPKSQTINFNFKKYSHHKIFNRSGKLYEASFNTSIPVEFNFFRFSAYINSRFLKHENLKQQLNVNGGISTLLPFRVNLRINSRFTFRDENIGMVNPAQSLVDFQFSKRILKQIFLRTNVKYSHWDKAVTNMGVKMDVHFLPHIKFDASVNRNNLLGINQYMLRFRLDMPFARHTSYTRGSGGSMAIHQNTSGSLLFNRNTGVQFDDQRKVGKAALLLNPFIDINNNGVKDAGEPSLGKISAKLYRESRNQEIRSKDPLIENLVPYERYTVEVEPQSLSSPFFHATKTLWSVQVLPNMVNTLNIPIVVVGEVSGVVNSEKPTSAIYGLTINLISEEQNLSEETHTYTGGLYYYVGLMPGKYVAVLDNEQLNDRSLIAEKDSISFEVKSSQEGDIVEGVNFLVRSSNEQSATPEMRSFYTIQIGAFKERQNAKIFADDATKIIGKPVTVIFNNKEKMYKCIVGKQELFEDAKDKLFEVLKFYPDPFIIEVPD